MAGTHATFPSGCPHLGFYKSLLKEIPSANASPNTEPQTYSIESCAMHTASFDLAVNHTHT